MLKVREDRRELAGRIEVARIAVGAAFALLASAYWYVQIVRGEFYFSLSENNRIRSMKLTAPRGYVLDRHGSVLVENEPAYSLQLYRREAKDLSASIDYAARLLLVTEDRFGDQTTSLVNAVTGHALDFDDVTGAVRGHVSVVLLPALLAMAETRDLLGATVVDAYVVGFDVATRLGRLVFDSHYGKGWHSTSVIGALSGAAACGRLLGLDAAAIDHAVGLSLAQAAGTRENFGSMAKPLQAGFAARAAVAAVRLAARGVTAGSDTLFGPYGFTRLYAGGEDDRAAFAPLDENDALAADAERVIVKKYPMCYAAHRAVDAMLELRAEHGLRAGDVAAIHVESSAGGHGPLIHHVPTIGSEAMFSLEYAMAAALEDGRIGCASFTDAQVNRAAISGLMARVTMSEVAGAILPPWSDVRLRLADGTRLSRRVDILRGSPELPLGNDELTTKLADAIAFGGRGGDAVRLAAAIHHLAEIPVIALLRGADWQALRRSTASSRRAP